MAAAIFELDHYLVRRKVFKIFGSSFHVYAGDRIVGFSKQKAFKLKEDIRVYADESMNKELLNVHARQIVDFSAAYDILDSESGQKVGAARRRGFRSLLRDSWELLDAYDQPLAQLREDSAGMAFLRRFLTNLIPQTFHIDDGGGPPIRFSQRFNPFVYRLDVTIPPSATLDRRLIFGTAVLIAAIEGRQN